MASTNSMLGALQGLQEPRINSHPEYVNSTGAEAIEIARMAGLELDPWQQSVLTHSLGEKPDGSWSAFEVGLCVARQNGKGSILEARELAGLFLLEEKLLVHTAHLFATAQEHFLRMVDRIDACDDFRRRVKTIRKSHGEEGIILKNGQRLLFKARVGGSLRGFTGNFIALDECMDLQEMMIGNMMPTLSAVQGSKQLWYTGSAVDQSKHANGLVFARIRERGMAGGPGLAYFEFSAPDDAASDSVEAWRQANPGLGIRISLDHVALEHASMPTQEFACERLGQGDWPATDRSDVNPISIERWKELTNVRSGIINPVVLSYDVTPDRARACIAACGINSEGLAHVEVVEARAGTNWLGERLRMLCEKHSVSAIVYDPAGPANAITLEDLGVEVFPVSAREHSAACGMLFDAVRDGEIVHLGDERILMALKGAVKRPLMDQWAWSRKDSGVDISPLVAITLALWGYRTHGSDPVPAIWNLADALPEELKPQGPLKMDRVEHQPVRTTHFVRA